MSGVELLNLNPRLNDPHVRQFIHLSRGIAPNLPGERFSLPDLMTIISNLYRFSEYGLG